MAKKQKLTKEQKKQLKQEQLEKQKIKREQAKQRSLQKKTRTGNAHSFLNLKKFKVNFPKTNQQIMAMLFKDITDNLFQIDDNTYSICFEYTDISFTRADYDEAGSIFLKWVDYLNSFTDLAHIQVCNASMPVDAEEFKEQFSYRNENYSENEKILADEFNYMIDSIIGTEKNILVTKRYLTISQIALSFEDAKAIFFNIYRKTEEKFKDLKSQIRIVSNEERLELIHDFWNVQTTKEKGIENLIDYSKENDLTLFDVLAPKEYISLREASYIEVTPPEIMDSDAEETKQKKKFIRCLYIEPEFPNVLTPKFYNMLTTLQDLHMITTINIQPKETKKQINKLDKLLNGLKTERQSIISKYAKRQLNYEYMKDTKLEEKIDNVDEMIYDVQHNDQKIFSENILVCILANSYAELEEHTVKVQNRVGEMLINLRPLNFQQLEGIQNVLPLGHNNLQLQHLETSEAVAVHVPFNSKDFQHEQSIFYGMNLVSRNLISLDRSRLLNGNGGVFATSGAGKSFFVKMMIEQIRLRYPQDEIIIVDFQREYCDIVEWFNGQTLTISDHSNTYLNPLDMNAQYSLSEEGTDTPIKAKIEYMQGWLESVIAEGKLSAIQKSIIDRCVNLTFLEYEKSGYDKEKQPLLKDFYQILGEQEEIEAKKMTKALERFVVGSQDIFSHPTNIDIHNTLINFDISQLPSSIQSAGYLIVLDHIMNRLTKNRQKGITTWIFIDEFHIMLANPSAAEYVAKIIKICRKYLGMMTVITQQVGDVLKHEQGEKILGNMEFAAILKLGNGDEFRTIRRIWDIPDTIARFFAGDVKAGQGVIKYGEDKIAFYNPVPRDFHIFKLNSTENEEEVK